MKITINELRRIIREVISQESTPPGKWSGDAGEPLDPEDLERLGGDAVQPATVSRRRGAD